MRSTLERGREVSIWSAFRFGLIAIIALPLGAVLLFFHFQPAFADQATPAFRDGHADREAWETATEAFRVPAS
jgi:hypothetical protein